MNWPFALWGGDGSDEGEGLDEGSEESSEPAAETLTLTQDELQAQIARAASRASRKATKSLREELGFTSQEELTSFITATRERQQEEQDESERARVQLEEERQALASDRSSLRNERISVAVERAIIQAGVTDEAKSKRIATLVRSDLDSEIDVADLADDINDVMVTLQKDMPELFAAKGARSFGSPDADDDFEPDDDAARRAKQEAQWKSEYASRGGIFQDTTT